MNHLQLFRSAKKKTEAALDRAPHMFPLESVISQLDYLISVEEGEESDRGPLATINLGQIAAHYLENFDRELAETLFRVSAAARQMNEKTGVG